MLDFNRLLERVKLEQKSSESSKNGPLMLDIKYDKSAKDIGVLLKLNNLMKRLDTIKHLTGDWKLANHKYANVTEQIKYVQTKLELLDEGKIGYFQKRAEILNQEVKEIVQQRQENKTSN